MSGIVGDPEPGPSRLVFVSPEPMRAAETEKPGHLYHHRLPSFDSATAPANAETSHRRPTTALEVPPHPASEHTWTSAPASPVLIPQLPSELLSVGIDYQASDPEPLVPTNDLAWGASQTAPTSQFHFNIEWLSLDRVSFRQTRTYRNAWNHGREIKISRDGTELDPETGKRLIEQWQALYLAG
jgi:hypothetical protein